MENFSNALTRRAGHTLAWVIEQLDLFDCIVPPGVTDFELEEPTPTITCSGVTLRAHLLGTYALDGTWLWSWANDSFGDIPGVVRARELRELGERENIPELTESLLDFNGFPNPRLAADHLLLICMGLLDARGGMATVFNDRGGRAFIAVDDDAIPRAEPRPRRLTHALTNGSALLPGIATDAVKGWFRRHGATLELGPQHARGVLKSGDIVTLGLEAGQVTSVTFTDPHGTPVPDTLPEQTLTADRASTRQRSDRLFPSPLLHPAAREIGHALWGTQALLDHAREHLDSSGEDPAWSPEDGALHYPGGSLRARLVAAVDAQRQQLLWASGTDEIRARMRELAEGVEAPGSSSESADIPELSDEPVDLSPYVGGEAVAATLVRAGASASGGHVIEVDNRFFMVTEPDLELPVPDLDTIAHVIEEGARLLHGRISSDQRPAVMQDVAVSCLQRFGVPVWRYGAPEFVSGVNGLYELRVYFGPEGTITGTSVGLLYSSHG